MTDARLQWLRLGQRHPSGAVALEATETMQRWETDKELLRHYGFGATKAAQMYALIKDHERMRGERPGAIAAKTAAVHGARAAVAGGRGWIDRADSMLRAAALFNPEITEGIGAAAHREVDGLDAETEAYLKLLQTHRALLDSDCDPDGLITEAAPVLEKLRAAAPQRAGARSAAISDTEEIDVLDGRLLEMVRLLNSAARKAFRALGQPARVEDYKYHHVRRRARDTAADAPADPPAPPLPGPASPA